MENPHNEEKNNEIDYIDLQEQEKNKKKKTRYFETYICKVLKNISLNGITINAKQQLNSALCIICFKISEIATGLTIISKKRTISDKEILNAIKIISKQSFSEKIISVSENILCNFKNKEKTTGSRQNKAGIIFPPSITEKFLRNFGFSKIMITKSSPILLAYILEIITFTILSNCLVLKKKKSRITIRDMELSVQNDTDISFIFKKINLSFIGGGVLPGIHCSLLNKKYQKKKKENETKKPHRFRPGTVCLREIKKFQKVSNCLTLTKIPFERCVRTIINKYTNSMKISKDVFILLQYYIEQFIVNFLKDVNETSIHCGRVKVMNSDLDFICRIKKLF